MSGKNLKIITNGGDGGPGQMGGDGTDGVYGSTPRTDPEYYHRENNCHSMCYEISAYGCTTIGDDPYIHTITGTKGTSGGDGGDGGQGGLGSPSGLIRLIT